jgi:hypothetical protein
VQLLITARRSVVIRSLFFVVAVGIVARELFTLHRRSAALNACNDQLDTTARIVPGAVLQDAVVIHASQLGEPAHVQRGDVVDVVAGAAGTWIFEGKERTLMARSCRKAVEQATQSLPVSAVTRVARAAGLGCARAMGEAHGNLRVFASALDRDRMSRGEYARAEALVDTLTGIETKGAGFRYAFIVHTAPKSFDAYAIGVEGTVAGDVWAVSHREGASTSEPIHVVDGCAPSRALDWP